MIEAGNEIVVVNDFTVIQVKVAETSRVVRHLYVKEHNVTDTHSCKPNGRTLLVLNVPPYVTEEGVKQVFSDCGTIPRIILQEKPTSGPSPNSSATPESLFTPLIRPLGYQVAYVIFKDKSSVSRATSMPYSCQRLLSSDKCRLVSGLEKWRQEYVSSLPPPADKLKAEIEQYMSEYDRKVEEEKEAAKKLEGVPDEEGWIKVTRLSKNTAAATSRPQSNDKCTKRKLKKRNREKELLHFYKFQVRESKKEQVMKLRQKFEEDKQQIARMKAARKFRPY